MKIFFYTTIIIGSLFVMACRKTRTCSCKVNGTTTTVTTPKNGGTIITTSSSSTNETIDTYSKVKKSDMTRFEGCNSKTETSTNSYSTTAQVPTKTVISGVTFTIPVNQPVDVVNTNVNDYTCEIK